jgi:hypothetical protein
LVKENTAEAPTKPEEDGSLFDIAKTSLTRSLASFSNTSDWRGPATSATR